MTRTSKRVAIHALAALALTGLGLAVGAIVFSRAPPAAPEAAEFLFLDEEKPGRLVRQKHVEVEGGRVDVGLFAESVWREFPRPVAAYLLVEMRPYIRVEFQGLRYSDFVIDPEDVVVEDSVGHRFRITGIWPIGIGGYRLDIDAVDFNRHVKYQETMTWAGPRCRWAPDKRYTFSLHLPFECKGRTHVVDIPRVVCYRKLVAIADVFGREKLPQWDKRAAPGEVFRGVRLDASAPIPLLVEALESEDPADRLGAAEALQDIGPKARAAVLPLVGALSDSDDAVRGAAAGAIQSIEGRDWREVERERKGKR